MYKKRCKRLRQSWIRHALSGLLCLRNQQMEMIVLIKIEMWSEPSDNSFRRTSSTSSSRKSHQPLLKELSTEFENLSHLAGMYAINAVILARTLSSSSLGFIQMEKDLYGSSDSVLKRTGSPNITAETDQALFLEPNTSYSDSSANYKTQQKKLIKKENAHA
ncbi:DEBR0S1_13916g1_1 [Brettanomyces bruxellensis]|uniref:DEBR0S1_13916g1_1 n=1 Tax=Dekkera bruxellensis TaxID=5007 RepID=A0A7D9GZV5_DEKBR|nr:DEBR0S1_13916g1_1 [Brettanomyces bruxellensis]